MESLLERAVAQDEAQLKAEQEVAQARAKSRQQSRSGGRRTRMRLHRTQVDDQEVATGWLPWLEPCLPGTARRAHRGEQRWLCGRARGPQDVEAAE